MKRPVRGQATGSVQARGNAPAGSFVQRHGLWNEAQHEAARRVASTITELGLELVRFAWADQHGIVRGKTLVAAEAIAAMHSGVGVVSTLLLKDTAHRTAWPVFSDGGGLGDAHFQGAGDVLLLADPTTFKLLPWSARSGWVLCDAYFGDGQPAPFDTRALYRRALEQLARKGHKFVAGLEVEFYLFRIEDAQLAPEDSGWPGTPPAVSLLNSGYQHLTEQRYDQIEPVLDLLRHGLQALDLPVRSLEIELGPSQCEFVFNPLEGMQAADAMILLRNAAKQIARRHGYLASFMCRPRIPNVMSSGWHLHQSLCDSKSGRNLFADPKLPLSATGRHYLGGLLAHGPGAAVFSTPTINGYRRYRPNSLAPDRANWGRDNRGVMLRVVGGPGDAATRIENRVGEPAANPYLYMASQIVAGLDGLAHRMDPGPSADTPYETQAARLPTSLSQALETVQADPLWAQAFGKAFVAYLVHIKRAELARFDSEVTEWEHREYFDLY